jgi:predicted nucleic acid-binding Zn ribbon protein
VIFIPSYVYHCNFCNVDETIERKMSEYKPVENCLVCGKQMNRKVEDILPQNYIVNCVGFYGKKS